MKKQERRERVKRMLYSYDIFDTILTRRTATPHGIFALMQKRYRPGMAACRRKSLPDFMNCVYRGNVLHVIFCVKKAVRK